MKVNEIKTEQFCYSFINVSIDPIENRNTYLDLFIKSCSDERQNGFKFLKLKHWKFLQWLFISCEHDCFCLKTLKHFLFKCLKRFLKISDRKISSSKIAQAMDELNDINYFNFWEQLSAYGSESEADLGLLQHPRWSNLW